MHGVSYVSLWHVTEWTVAFSIESFPLRHLDFMPQRCSLGASAICAWSQLYRIVVALQGSR